MRFWIQMISMTSLLKIFKADKFALIVIVLLLMTTFFLIRNFVEAKYQKDLDCADFKTQQDAQREFESHDIDIYHLDANNNGVACQSLP